jgi:hypothetical protein
MIKEAEKLLSIILTVPCPADAVLLTLPILTHSIEYISCLACNMVISIIEEATHSLLVREVELKRARDILVDALALMSDAESLHDTLKTQSEEIGECIRRAAKTMIDITEGTSGGGNSTSSESSETAAAPAAVLAVPGHEKTSKRQQQHYYRHHIDESMLMIEEEIRSRQHIRFYTDNEATIAVNDVRRDILEIEPQEWLLFSRIFTNSPSDEIIELMRSIMLIINFTPNKRQSFVGASFKGILLMDSNTVARSAAALLCSTDFSKQLIEANPRCIREEHIAAIALINRRLSQLTRYDLANMNMNPNMMTEDNVDMFFLLRTFSEVMERWISVIQVERHQCSCLESLMKAKDVLRAIHDQRMKESEMSKKEQRNDVLTQMQCLDTELGSIRDKMGCLQLIIDNPDERVRMIQSSLDFVVTELEQISFVKQCIVADSCIASVVLLRAGWLPEQIRVECTEVFRSAVKEYYSTRKMKEQQQQQQQQQQARPAVSPHHSTSTGAESEKAMDSRNSAADNENSLSSLSDEEIVHFQVSDTPFLLGSLIDRVQCRHWTRNASNICSLLTDVVSLSLPYPLYNSIAFFPPLFFILCLINY